MDWPCQCALPLTSFSFDLLEHQKEEEALVGVVLQMEVVEAVLPWEGVAEVLPSVEEEEEVLPVAVEAPQMDLL